MKLTSEEQVIAGLAIGAATALQGEKTLVKSEISFTKRKCHL